MSNAQSAFDFYVGQGLSPAQASGIVGNLQGESGQDINPTSISKGDGRDGSDSIGIAQWNGTRAQALKDYAASKGVPWSDLNTQLEFLHQELQGPEKAAYGQLMAAQTPEDAGNAMLAFERPKDWNKPGAHPERAKYAAAAFKAYGGGQGSPAPQAAPVSPAAAPGTPLSIAPQQTPIFAQAPQAAPQGDAGGAPIQMPSFQPPQPASIFYAQRRAPDLTRLRSALSQAPIFAKGSTS